MSDNEIISTATFSSRQLSTARVFTSVFQAQLAILSDNSVALAGGPFKLLEPTRNFEELSWLDKVTAGLFFLIYFMNSGNDKMVARKRPISLDCQWRLLQHSGENLGQGQLDAACRVPDLAACSERVLLSIVGEHQDAQGITDMVVALGHYAEAVDVGSATVVLASQHQVDQAANDQQHEGAVNPAAHGGIPGIDQPAGKQCSSGSNTQGSQGDPQEPGARMRLQQGSGIRHQGREWFLEVRCP